jgi:hypothetical protein
MLRLKRIPSFGEASALFGGRQFNEPLIFVVIGDGLVDRFEGQLQIEKW